MKSKTIIFTVLAGVACAWPIAAAGKKSASQESPLDRYAAEAAASPQTPAPSPGSIWTPNSRYADLGRDLKAGQVNDIVTIVVSESASAVSSGSTKTQRKSSASSSISAVGGVTRAAGPLANLANLGGNSQLDGSGTTTRQTVLTTTLTARVAAVLANGNLLIEGSKDVQINSERQTILVRGVIRPEDLAADNSVRSNRLAQMEIKLNGKGVVGDSIRRPFILYRLLLGILPF